MDLLLNRYSGNIEFILNMDIDDSLSLISKALEKVRDEELFRIWLVMLQNMDNNTYKSFEQFRDETINAQKRELAKQLRNQFKEDMALENAVSDNEAINKAEDILKMMNGNGATEWKKK